MSSPYEIDEYDRARAVQDSIIETAAALERIADALEIIARCVDTERIGKPYLRMWDYSRPDE